MRSDEEFSIPRSPQNKGLTPYYRNLLKLNGVPESELNSKKYQRSLLQFVRQTVLKDPRFRQLYNAGQAYIVDQFSRVEDIRMSYHEDIAKKLAYDEEQFTEGNNDAPGQQGNSNKPGGEKRKKILRMPESIVGGDGYLRKRLEDSIYILARRGDATFFVTATMPVARPEYTKSRHAGMESASDPIVGVQIFNEHKKKFYAILVKHLKIRGKNSYKICSQEYQKRGFLHIHCIIRASDHFRYRPTSLSYGEELCVGDENVRIHYGGLAIDDIISTKSFHAGSDKTYLNALIQKFMVHGHTKDCRSGKFLDESRPCKRNFPANMASATHLDEKSGRWIYQRNVGDEMVVPYSPELLMSWGGHVNVLASSGSRQIGYLFGYVQKGKFFFAHGRTLGFIM